MRENMAVSNFVVGLLVISFVVVHLLTSCNASLIQYLPLQVSGLPQKDVIEAYFHFGFSYKEMLGFLQLYHNITIGYRQLQRILRRFGLRRHSQHTDTGEVIDSIQKELNGSGRDVGYRSMHNRIRQKYGLTVSRETVRIILAHIDPENVSFRRRRRLSRRIYHVNGPNYLWHIDGWDKLKQFGLCVHGCIDGYSRRIMWLEVCATNNDPYVVCQYFARCVKLINGSPCQIRADCGTENVNVEMMQRAMGILNESLTETSPIPFLYGKSTANQRIEAWWSKFGMLGMSTWIHHFKSMSNVGIIDTSRELDIQCIIFCYIELLQSELQTIVELWNTHYIRKSNDRDIPHGRPDSMYFMPEMHGGTNGLKTLHSREADILSDILSKDMIFCKDNYRELFTLLMEESDKASPRTLDEAADLLVYLLDHIEHEQYYMDVVH